MASWIVHLRIAENLLRRIPGLEAGPFAVGNIAPDSGIPDEKWEHFNPPPWVTHFGVEDSLMHTLADLGFYRRYLQPLRGKGAQGPVSFRLGYFFHLLTDNLWAIKIGHPTQERWKEQFAADKEFIWEVKKDWYGLDFCYVRDHPDCLYRRVFLTARPETGGLEFLPLKAVRQRVAYIQGYYQRTDESVRELLSRPYVYLSRADADRFVMEASRRVYRIYKQFWVRGSSPDGFASALDSPMD
jgi:hypothetical protein